jgi:hypothetical protein
MGNTQSAEEPRKLEKVVRQQNRLSKPRTNTSTSNLLAFAPPIPSSRHSSKVVVSDVSMMNNKRSSSTTLLDSQDPVVDVAKLKEKEPKSMFRSKPTDASQPLRERMEQDGPKTRQPGPMDRYMILGAIPYDNQGDTRYLRHNR